MIRKKRETKARGGKKMGVGWVMGEKRDKIIPEVANSPWRIHVSMPNSNNNIRMSAAVIWALT